ncbi:MAG: ABC transporter substrate-binding protein [Parvibaculaceae bacterium]
MNHLLRTAACAIAAILFATPAAQADNARELRVTNTSCVCFLPTNLAIKRGWLEAELNKLDVTLTIQQYEDGPSQTAAFLSGSLDLAQYGSTGAASLLARGADIKLFMLSDNEIDTEGLVAKKDSGIGKVQDLVGKKVGVTAGTTSDYGLRAALKQGGVDAKEVNIIGVAPPAMAAAWERGDIEAAYVWDPILSRLANAGGVKLQTIGELAKATSGKYRIVNFYAVRSEYATQNPDVVRAYVKAIDQATTYIRDHAEEVAAEFQKDMGAETPEQAMQQIKGEEFFLSREQLGPELMGDGSAPGAMAKVLMDVWSFSFEQGNITAAPDEAVIHRSLDPQYLK